MMIVNIVLCVKSPALRVPPLAKGDTCTSSYLFQYPFLIFDFLFLILYRGCPKDRGILRIEKNTKQDTRRNDCLFAK